jgi:YidC/Oxa1 family membrane protein insertase
VNPLNPLYIAVAWVMTHIHSGLGTFLDPNSGLTWVLTIVVLVVAMRLVLVPLFVKQMHAMRKMSALTPQLQELRKKYKNDKQTLNEETMRLYKEAGVNPLGGCLPLLAQMPLFFALFSVLRAMADWHPGLPAPYHMPISVVESALHANILGAHIYDKVLFTGTMYVPLHAKIVILCAVAISVATTFMTVRQSTKRGMTPQMTPDNPMASSQKYMAYIVPFFALSGLYWAFGLVLYWVTTNVWTLGQQYVLFKRYPPTVPATATATGTSPTVSVKPATAAGLVSGGKQVARKPSAPRPASDAVKRPAPAKPGAARPAAAKPAAAKTGAPKPGAAQSATARSGAAKPANGARPAAGTKPAAAGSKPAAAGSKPAATGTRPAAAARPTAATPSPAKSPASSSQPSRRKTSGATGSGGTAQRKPQPARPAAQEASSGNGSGSVSGILRRFGKGRTETEEQPQEPDVKLVRQQRVRQSRSKRSGKH